MDLKYKKFLIAALLSFALVGCGETKEVEATEPVAETKPALPESEANSAVQNSETKVSSEIEVTEKTFGITPDEFGKRISAEVKKVGLGDVPIGKFNVQKGAVNDVFTEKLSDAVMMNGTVDKNGELKGITFIMGQTDKGDQEIMNMMMMAGLSARALSPDLPKEQTAGAITETVVEAVKKFNETGDGKASKVVDGVKYGAMANKEVGIWAYFEPA